MAYLVPILEFLGACVMLALAYSVALVVRRRAIARNGGTFELSYRARSDRAGRGWVLGIGRYDGERLEWFRIFSLSPLPKRSWNRSEVELVGRRAPEGSEREALYADHVIVVCRTLSGPLELAMGQQSLTGFQAWLEAMAPGSRGVRPGDSPASI